MLMSASERSPVTNWVPPLRRAMSWAVWGVICIKPRAPASELLVAKPGLGVDHGGDQRGVHALVGRLLADDVVVAKRQGELADRLVEIDLGLIATAPPRPRGRPLRRSPATGAGETWAGCSARSGPAAGSGCPRRAHAASGDSAASAGISCATSLLELGQRAVVRDHVGRPSPPSPPERAGGRCGPRALGARGHRARRRALRRPRPRTTVASKAASMPVSNSSGTSTTATDVSAGSDRRHPAIRSPTSGCSSDSSQASSSGRSKTIVADRWRGPPRRRPAPPRPSARRAARAPRSRRAARGATASVDIVAAPSRAKAASASDLPAATAPVSPTKSTGQVARRLGSMLRRSGPRARPLRSPRSSEVAAPRPGSSSGSAALGLLRLSRLRLGAAGSAGRPPRTRRGRAPPRAPSAWRLAGSARAASGRGAAGRALDALDAERDPAALLVDLEDPDPGRSPGWTTSLGFSTWCSASSEMWTRPSTPGMISTNAPNATTFVTLPSSTSPGRYSSSTGATGPPASA